MPARPADIETLRTLIRTLRGPDGCPWDREQTLDSVRAYLLEEAHETAAALDTPDRSDLSNELGDLLFQVVFVAQLAEEEGLFDLGQVIDENHHKMVERHPHVFGEEQHETAEDVARAWERRKETQRTTPGAALAGVPTSLPALLGAYRLGQKAAALGFDWADLDGVWAKVEEELRELRQAQADAAERGAEGTPDPAVEEELGDLLFVLTSLARHQGVDPERALAQANAKFRTRFAHVEAGVAGRWQETSAERLDELWNAAKAQGAVRSSR